MLLNKVLNSLKAGSCTLNNLTSSTFHLFSTSNLKSSTFLAAMSEALDKLVEVQELKKQERKDAEATVKDMQELKRKLKRRKWVDWNNQDEGKTEVKRQMLNAEERIKRKKCAILLGYSGANYFGMQRNPGMQTIEEELFKAMLKHKWITNDSFEQVQLAYFQRAARTDKGVSAARQVCSIKLPENLNIEALNDDLPSQIRLFAVERVTKGFNAKDQCSGRSYTYTMPSIAFANVTNNEVTLDYKTFRLPVEQLQKARDILQRFEGTKNYHNFTSRKSYFDPSAKRFIMTFTCSDTFISPQNIEFVTLIVKGQSFMMHQIRKMVGLTIAIVRGLTDANTLNRAFTDDRIDIPMAPGLGLILDKVHYERYNERYGKDGIHNPLTWEKQETQIQQFKENKIMSKIYETEFEEKPLLQWLETLPLHTYDVRKDEEDLSKSISSEKLNKDDNEE